MPSRLPVVVLNVVCVVLLVTAAELVPSRPQKHPFPGGGGFIAQTEGRSQSSSFPQLRPTKDESEDDLNDPSASTPRGSLYGFNTHKK